MVPYSVRNKYTQSLVYDFKQHLPGNAIDMGLRQDNPKILPIMAYET
jgi:hypothetical protein